MTRHASRRLFAGRGLTAASAAAVLIASGCGGGHAAPAVQLALTAPTDGSVVSVTRVKVFGTVVPAGAAVDVDGQRADVLHGTFARWVIVPAGTSHISVSARAAGYVPANLRVAVHSSPTPAAKTATSAGASEPESASPPNHFASPAPGVRYDARVRATLLRACNASAGGTSAASTSCECFLSHLEKRVSERTVIAWEVAFLKGEATLPGWLREAALACKRA